MRRPNFYWKHIILMVIAVLFLSCCFAFGEENAVPSAKGYLGYELGKQFTPHYQVVNYLKAVAEASERIVISQYGMTEEGRELVLLTISDPENLAKVEAIRKKLLRLTDPRSMSDQATTEEIISNNPGILWLSYGVHGNESCSSESAMKVVYRLASADDQETMMWLQNLVILVDPMLNPDGRDRYVNWYNSVVGDDPNPHSLSAEHREPWPGGRGNHYLFDLNRDWTWMVQKETRARLKQYHRWMPQVHVDFHEMGYTSSYFFFPATIPINPILPRETVEKWGQIFGKGNAEMLDRHGIPYFSGEQFDLFYPGYGDCYPSFNGAIGMTYEQGGGGYAGLTIKRPTDTILTLKQRLNNHYFTSLATIKTFAHNREKRLRDYYDFWESALNEENLNGPRYVFIRNEDRKAKHDAFVQLLLDNNIEVNRALKTFSTSAVAYGDETAEKRSFEKNTLIIDLLQPQGHLARALLEPRAQKLDTLYFYDITSWSLPYAYNLDAYWSTKKRSFPLEKIERLENVEIKPAPKSNIGYLVRWGDLNAIQFLSHCFQEKINVRQAYRSFKLQGRHYDRGTLVVLVYDNQKIDDLHQKLVQISQKTGTKCFAAQTGFTEAGINLGSSKNRYLEKPKVLLLREHPVSSTAMGAVWHLLDKQVDYPVSLLNIDLLKRSDISDYNVLIMPPARGSGKAYKSKLDSATVNKLKEWVSHGGTIIGIEEGAYFLSKDFSKLANISLRKEEKSKKKKEKEDKKKLSKEEIQKRKRTVHEKQVDRWEKRVPGTIVEIELDQTHPLGFGMPYHAYVLKTNDSVFELAKKGNNVGIYVDEAKVTGYLSEKNMERINGGVNLYHNRLGQGNLILFTDDPNFRGFWRGLTQLFCNAIFLFASSD